MHTIFNWWSITKLFTAAAVMRLVDAGELDLDDPVGRYLPWANDIDRSLSAVTLRGLLSHSSGLPDNVPEVIGWMHGAGEPEQNQTAFARRVFPDYARLVYEPGSRHRYSNVGYTLLGAVIEAVTGTEYIEYLEAELLRPLGMTQSGFRQDRIEDLDKTEVATGSHLIWRFETPFLYAYYLGQLDWLIAEYSQRRIWFNEIIPNSHPPTGLRGSAADLLLFAEDMLRGYRGVGNALVSHKSVLEMITPQLSAPGELLSTAIEEKTSSDMQTAHGLGFALHVYQGELVAQHAGGGAGFNAALWLLPDRDIALVLLTNDTRVQRRRIMESLLRALDTTSTLPREREQRSNPRPERLTTR